ncbi:hypothetical protein ACHHYP_07198 [Achlya hypogyna]|uniref:Uncharacterized protein n=1 Tax=Achlya hypogyna TaxID=1202772 RepID=A0A1V9ZMI3_ACHHY|nr:hypothetical protein ACHHYP_07198 [Achlya hypogyna]
MERGEEQPGGRSTPSAPLRAATSLPTLEPRGRDTADLLHKVHGFYCVKNEDDLRECMEGLNTLFSRAVDMEMDEAESPKPAKPKKAPRSTATPRSPRSAAYLAQATEILASEDPALLISLLDSPDMTRALNITGIRKEDLKPKTREHFLKERHRAWHVPVEIAAMRFKHHEKARRNSLALLLQVLETDETPQPDPVKDFDRELDHERHLLEEMIRGRLRYEKILEKEAEMIRRKRDKFLVQENGVFHRKADESRLAELKDHMHKERGEANRAKMERVQQQRRLLEQTRQLNAEARHRFEQSRSANTKKEKHDRLKQKQLLDEDRERRRLQVAEDAKESDRQRRELIELAVQEKVSSIVAPDLTEAYLQEKRSLTLRKNLIAKEHKRLSQQEREITVQRMKNIQAHKKEEAAKKIQATYQRVDNLKEVRRAILQERNRIHVLTRSRKAHCRGLRDEMDLLPGPGEYNVRWAEKPRGGCIGHASAHDAVQATPGPGAYEYNGSIADEGRNSGPTFPKSRALATLEASIGPGPGQYIDPLAPAKSLGPSFSLATLSPLELSLRHAAELPAPCDYSTTTGTPGYAKATKDFKRSLHAMTTSYLVASKDKEEIMIDKDVHALETVES